MFKRANKLTALLVAAASVMSIVPAMAADTTRLGTKEGTIENAVAFKDGKYVYEGYKTDDDDKSVYYNAGDKDKELTDLTDGDLEYAYSDKYAYVTDGSDEYLVDLTDGKVIDDETPEDKEDTAATKLKTALKKTDRYGDSVVVSNDELTRLANGAKFGDTWYKYEVTTAGDSDYNDVSGVLYGYTDGSGKYIDASNIANVYAYSSAKKKVVKVEDFSKKANDGDSDTKLQAELIEAPKFLAQDKDNIYQSVKVKITDYNSDATSAGQAASAKVIFPTTDADVTTPTVTKTSAKYVIDYSKAPVTNDTMDTFAIGTRTYTYDTTATGAELTKYSSALDLQTKANAFFGNTANKVTGYTYSASTTTFTADTAGAIAAGAPASIEVVATGSPLGISTWTDGQTNSTAASFVVADETFEYDAAATAGDAQKYKSLSDLKAKVKTFFSYAVNLTAITGTANDYTFNDSTYTFTAKDATVSAAKFADDTNTNVSSAIAAGNGKVWTTTYIQKISKAQGDTKDDAYLPKTVTSYELSKNYYDNGDGDDAYDAAEEATSWQVINGTLAAVRVKSDNVKVSLIDLKKDKVKFENGLPTGFDADDKVDVYLAEKGDDDDTDVQSGEDSFAVDVNGDVWAINEGKIKKFVSGEFKDQYTADRSLDSIDVYDEKNLIAWDKSGDVYTAVNEGTKVTQDEANVVAPVIVTGWVKGTDGTWTFNDATGTKVASKWINVGGAWYYLKSDGIMATGWLNDNGTWYYLTGSGAMATGWLNDNGTWYYLAGSGAMLANTTVDGYKLGASGAWIR